MKHKKRGEERREGAEGCGEETEVMGETKTGARHDASSTSPGLSLPNEGWSRTLAIAYRSSPSSPPSRPAFAPHGCALGCGREPAAAPRPRGRAGW